MTLSSRPERPNNEGPVRNLTLQIPPPFSSPSLSPILHAFGGPAYLGFLRDENYTRKLFPATLSCCGSLGASCRHRSQGTLEKLCYLYNGTPEPPLISQSSLPLRRPHTCHQCDAHGRRPSLINALHSRFLLPVYRLLHIFRFHCCGALLLQRTKALIMAKRAVTIKTASLCGSPCLCVTNTTQPLSTRTSGSSAYMRAAAAVGATCSAPSTWRCKPSGARARGSQQKVCVRAPQAPGNSYSARHGLGAIRMPGSTVRAVAAAAARATSEYYGAGRRRAAAGGPGAEPSCRWAAPKGTRRVFFFFWYGSAFFPIHF